MKNLKKIIDIFASREKCIAGVCDANPLPMQPEGFVPFVSKNLEKRINPAANLPGAKSIIVLGVQYEVNDFPPIPEGAGIISGLAIAQDYHVMVKALLKKLVSLLKGYTDFTRKILVDSPNLDERALAVKAGLGYMGKHGLVISPKYGSRFNIGLLLTDIPIPDYKCQAIESCLPACDACNKCIEACPSGALKGGFDAANCISYLTQKGSLTPEEEIKMGRHLYGCDICQDACPKNKPAPTAWAMPADWLNMSDDEFAKAYGHTPMSWRGAEMLRRNAKIVISNRSLSQTT